MGSPTTTTAAPALHPATPASLATPPTETANRPTRWGRRLLIGLALVAVVVWFAPGILARTDLRHHVGKLLIPTFRGSTHLGETSLGWTSPIIVRDVLVRDRLGQPLITIGELRSSATLWSILTNPKTYGQFDLQRTVVHVQVAADGATNLDETIADVNQLPVAAQPKSMRLVIPAATIEVRQTSRPTTAMSTDSESAAASETLTDVSLLVEMDAKAPQGTTVVVSLPSRIGSHQVARLPLREAPFDSPAAADSQANTESPTGGVDKPISEPLGGIAPRVRLTIQYQPKDEAPLQFKFEAHQWNLAELAPILAGFSPGTQLAGTLHGSAEWRQTGATFDNWQALSQLQATDVALAGLPQMGRDQLRLAAVGLTGAVSARGELLQLSNLELSSDLGRLRATGALQLPQLLRAAQTQDLFVLVDDEFDCEGAIDLALLAQRLPQTLRLREDVAVTAGRVQLQARSGRADNGRTWTANAKVVDLTANAAGQPLRWEQAIEADAVVRQSDRELVCDKLAVRSDFLEILGQGTLKSGRFRLKTDLDRLTTELAPLINWQGWQLAGRSQIDGQFTDHNDGTAGLSIQGVCEQWNISGPGLKPWSESRLDASLQARGHWNERGWWDSLETATASITSGEDRLTAALRQPVLPLAASTPVPVQVDVVGDWGRWLRRVEAATGPLGIRLAGQGQLAAQVTSTAAALVVDRAQFDAANWDLELPGLRMVDPRLQVTTAGRLQWSPLVWTAPETQLHGEFGDLTWRDGRYELASTALVPIAGRFEADVDVGRISRWRQGDIRQHALGSGRGTVTLQPGSGTQVTGAADLTIESFVLATYDDQQGRWQATWREPQLRSQGRGTLALDTLAWKIEEGQLASDGLKILLAGHGAMPADRLELDVRGELAYQWDRLMTRLDPSWSQQFRLQGAGQRPFALKGTIPLGTATPTAAASTARLTANPSAPLIPGDLSGQLALSWEQAQAYGLALGPTEMALQFANGQGQLSPLEIPIAEGRVRLAPRFDLRSSPGVVTLPAGRIVDQIRLSPELCSQWLRYVTPLLGDATAAEGRFSVDLTQGAWPLSQPLAGQATGSIAIESTQVRPGALALRVYDAIEQVRALLQRRAPRSESPERIWLELPDQQVAFRQQQGRIAHDRFLVRMGDVEVVTTGSVGIDETLQMVVEVPIRKEWLGDQKLLAALAGQAVKLPLTGTVRQPQIDVRAVGDLARQATGGAVERALENQVQKQLERLLPGRR